jgi:hypothetical protein
LVPVVVSVVKLSPFVIWLEIFLAVLRASVSGDWGRLTASLLVSISSAWAEGVTIAAELLFLVVVLFEISLPITGVLGSLLLVACSFSGTVSLSVVVISASSIVVTSTTYILNWVLIEIFAGITSLSIIGV